MNANDWWRKRSGDFFPTIYFRFYFQQKLHFHMMYREVLFLRVSAVIGTTRFLLPSGRPHHSKVFNLLLNGTPCKLYTIGLMQELNIRSRITCWTTGQSFSTNWTGEEEIRYCLGSRLRYKSYWWWKPFGWLFSCWKWRRLCI